MSSITGACDGPRQMVELAHEVEAMRQRIVTELEAAVRSREALEQRGELVLRLREGLAPSSTDVPALPHAARLIPAEGLLAGDFYDVTNLAGGRVGLVMVDVAGHGADAGLFAYRLKALLSSALRSGFDPAEVLAWTARQLGETGERFATALIAVIETATGQGRYASAGHQPPLLLGDVGTRSLVPTGPLLGPLDATWHTGRFALREDGLLVAFTDGLVEARNRTGTQFGVGRLLDVLGNHQDDGPDSLVEACVGAVRGHVGGQRLADDCTIVVLGWPDRRQRSHGPPAHGERRGRGGLRAMVPPGPLLEVHLAAEASSGKLARALVHQALTGTRWARRSGAVEEAVAELMGACAVRPGSVASVRLDGQGRRLRGQVRGVPAGSEPLPTAGTSGWHLPAVEAMADEWGAIDEDGSTTVWFDLAEDL